MAVEVAAGAVVMLGGPWVGVPGQELGGIGKKVSTITILGELASTALREALWRDAETLVPKSYAANAATSEPDAKAAVDAPAPTKDAPAKKSVKQCTQEAGRLCERELMAPQAVL